MALPTDELAVAWRALKASDDQREGWRTIGLANGQPSVKAGVMFPDRGEAILAGFILDRAVKPSELPTGRGFTVQAVHSPDLDPARKWFSLSRREDADGGLFLTMAQNIVETLASSDLDDDALLARFLQRIVAWQMFMERTGGLDRETEIGLHGELVVLQDLLDEGIPAARAIEAWAGPLGALHDFTFGSAALEVKTTAARSGFPVKIGSLDQLELSTAPRLFLVGIRMAVQQDGLTLPERIRATRERLTAHRGAMAAFETRILAVGYSDADSERFSRQLALVERRNLEILPDFPRLARSLTSPAILNAKYELDLDLIAAERLSNDRLRELLGAQPA